MFPETRAEKLIKEGIRCAARGADFLLQTTPVYIPRFSKRIGGWVGSNKTEAIIYGVFAGLATGSCTTTEIANLTKPALFITALGVLLYAGSARLR